MQKHLAFLDFFAGSGLAGEALKADFRPVWANDVCPKKKRVYVANHGDGHFHEGCVETLHGRDIPAADLSWASFPCQDLSLAGNLGGLDANRSGLVWSWLKIIDEMRAAGKKPRVVAAENVVGLVSADGGAHYRALHAALARRGYNVGPLLLNAIRWLPQSRPRVFVVGVDKRRDIRRLRRSTPNWAHPPAVLKAVRGLEDAIFWDLPEPEKRTSTLSDLLEADAPCDPRDKARRNLALIPAGHMARLRESARQGLAAAPGYRRIRNRKQVLELRFDDTAGCLRAPRGGSSRQILVLPRGAGFDTRLITVREAARLMGADDYILPGVNDDRRIPGGYNEGYMAMGDAVAVPAVRFLSRHLLAGLAAQAPV